MRLLRRFGLIGQKPEFLKNKEWLKKRQLQQLNILEKLKDKIEPSFLNYKIEDLIKAKNQKVFNTFTARCLKPQIIGLNALADVNIQRALQKRGHEKVPFSVKDHLKVEGMISTCGFSDKIIPSNDSSDVVILLQNEGCVPFAHTNVPQGLLGIQSTNPVYGTSYNPHNLSFLSGGSSGGEGALVASKATAFGLGSDSGGSARIPAAFCGIYGYKPTGSKRLSVKGRLGSNGQQGLKIGDLDTSMGFLTRSIDDLVWLCSKTLGKTIQGPQLYGGEWDQSRYQASKRKKLRVGYMYNNPQMKVAPAIVNTIQQTLQKLRNKKHEIVKFEYQSLQIFRNYFFKFFKLTGFFNSIYKIIDGHAISPQALPFYDLTLFGKLGIKGKLKSIQSQTFKQLFSSYLRQQTIEQFLMIHKQLLEYKKSFFKEWKSKEIDVLITPVTPFTAIYPGTTELLVYQLTYCCFQNVLQLPAGSIPTRLVLPNETSYDPHTPFEYAAAASIRNSAGLPLAIQVTGQHLKDQECLGAMWQISKINGKYLQPVFQL